VPVLRIARRWGWVVVTLVGWYSPSRSKRAGVGLSLPTHGAMDELLSANIFAESVQSTVRYGGRCTTGRRTTGSTGGKSRAISSAGEHCLHTAGVTGSNPVSPTSITAGHRPTDPDPCPALAPRWLICTRNGIALALIEGTRPPCPTPHRAHCSPIPTATTGQPRVLVTVLSPAAIAAAWAVLGALELIAVYGADRR
jgi:hypothetical protein